MGITRNGTACMAWAMEGGLCYFHANRDKVAELGRNGEGGVNPLTSSLSNISPRLSGGRKANAR